MSADLTARTPARTALATARRPVRPATGRPARPRLDFDVGVIVIVCAQAVWLAVLMSRGWYYQADFSNLAGATHRPLSLSYLTTSQGGHLGIVSAAVLWVLNRAAALNYPVTIALRVLAQAVTTLLLARLLVMLTGRRPGLLAVVALYAFSPLLVQSTLWLTASIGFEPAQILILLTLIAHVRYAVTMQLRWAAAAAVSLLAATLVSELSAVTALILPVLSLAFLHAGPLRKRVRALLACWPEWAMLALPIVGFAGYLLGSGRYRNGTLGVTAGEALRVVGGELAHSIGPALMGGPFAWNSDNGNYFAFTAAPRAVEIASGALVALLVAASVRRTGWRALAAWAMVPIFAGVGIVVVAIGRYHEFGELITRRTEYSGAVAIPAAVALTLAWWRTSPEDIRSRSIPASGTSGAPGASATAPPTTHGTHHWQPSRRILAIALVLPVLAASMISAITYTQHWAQSPAKAYVTNLRRDIRAAGPGVTLFDTYVDPTVIPGIEPNRHISHLVGLLGAKVHFDQGPSAPLVVASDGHLRTPTFYVSASVVAPSVNSFCRNLVTGSSDRIEPLAIPVRNNEWYLRIDYFQQHASVINIWLVDARGHSTAPTIGSAAVLTDKLGRLYLRFDSTAPVAVRIRGGSAATNACLTAVALGYPFTSR